MLNFSATNSLSLNAKCIAVECKKNLPRRKRTVLGPELRHYFIKLRWAIFNHLSRLYPIHLVLEHISWSVHWNVNTIVQTCTHWDWKLCKMPFWLLTTSFLNTNYLLQTLNILNAYEFYLNVIECVVGEQTHIFCIPFMRMDWQVFVLIKRRFANATHSSNIHSNSYHNFLVLCAFLFKLRVQNKIIVAHGHFKKLFNKRMELAHTLIRWL